MQVLGYVLFVILTINYRTRCCQFQLTNHSHLEEHGSEAIVWNYLGLHEPREHQYNEFNDCPNSVLWVSRTKNLCVAVHHQATNNVMAIRAGIHSTVSCNSSLALPKKRKSKRPIHTLT